MQTHAPTNDVEVVTDLPNHEYHRHESISKSGLDLIARAPALYQYRRANPQPPTPAMRMGTLVHMAILEPHLLASECTVAPKIDRRTAAGKAEWEAFQIAAEGREVVTVDEIDQLGAIRDAVRAHPAAATALDMIREVETSIFWTDPETGIRCRCRPDAVLTNGLILDVKTTKDARPDEFARSIANYRYHVQAAFYSTGYEAAFGEAPKGFVFLAVETEAPHLCAVYVASREMKLRGTADFRRDLDTLKLCRETGEWPGLPTVPTVLELPKWA